MASTIEERVVEMKFDNQEFERNVQTSISTLDKLKMALDLDGAAKGFNEIQRAADKVDLTGIEKGADAVAVKFSAMQIAGMTAISELTKSFLNFGKNIWNITFGQIKSGGMARALKIEQANFKLQALAKNIEGVNDNVDAFVKKMSDAADAAVTGTAYGYDSAMSVVSQLVASGIKDADKMEGYLKGIAGAAAMTGRSFDDIGNIFTTIASNGKLMTMQLRQFSAAGLNVSAELARQFNKTEQQINEMVTKGQIGFEDFANALSKAYGDSAQKADDTFAGVTSNIKAQLSRLGQLFAAPYIENMIPVLKNVKAALKSLNNAMKPVADRFAKVMKAISKIGQAYFENLDFSRVDATFRGLENIFWGIVLVLNAVREAFEETFPKKSLKELQDAAYEFEQFTESILPTKEALNGIKNGIKLLLVPVKLVVKIIGSLLKALKPVIYMIFQFIYAVLSLGDAFGAIISSMIEAIAQSSIFDITLQIIATVIVTIINVVTTLIKLLHELFMQAANAGMIQAIGDALKSVVGFIERRLLTVLYIVYAVASKIFEVLSYENITEWAKNFYGNIEYVFGVIASSITSIINGVSILGESDNILADGIKLIKEFFVLIFEFFKGGDIAAQSENVKSAFEKLKTSIRTIGDVIKELFRDMDANKIIMFAFAAVFITFSLTLVRLIQSLSYATDQVGTLAHSASNLLGSFNMFRNMIRSSKMFLYYATSIVVVAGAMYQLSKVPTDKLLVVSSILAVFTAALIGFAIAMRKIAETDLATPKEVMSVKNISQSLIAIAASVALLSLALRFISTVDIDLKKAITSVSLIVTFIASMASASIAISRFSGDKAFALTALSIVAMGLAITMVVKAFAKFSQLDLNITIKQIVAFSATLLSFGAVMALASNATAGAALSMVAFALMMSMVIKSFEDIINMDVNKLDAGLKLIMKMINKTLLPLIMIVGTAARIGHGYAFDMGGVSLMILSLIPFLVVTSYLVSYLGSVQSDLSRGIGALGAISTMLLVFIAVIGIIGVFAVKLESAGAIPEGSSTDITNGKGKSVFKRTTTKNKAVAKIYGCVGLVIAFTVAVAALSAVAVGLGKTTSSLKRGLLAISIIVGIITFAISAIMAMSQFTEKAKLAPILASFITFGLLISAIIALTFAAMVNPEALIQAASLLTAVILAMTLLFKAMALRKGGDIKNVTNWTSSASDILLALLALTPLIIAVGAFMKLSTENVNMSDVNVVINSLIGLGGVLAGLVIFFGFIRLFAKEDTPKQILSTAAIVTSFGILVGSVAAIMYAMKGVDSFTNLANTGSIVLVLVAIFGGIYKILESLRSFRNVIGETASFDLLKMTLTSLAMMIIPLIAVAASLKLLATDDATSAASIGTAAASMVAIMLSMALILKVGKSMLKNKTFDAEKILSYTGSIIILSYALIMIAEAFNLMPADDFTVWIEKLIGLTGGLVILTGIIGVLGKIGPKSQKALVSAGSVVVISLSLLSIAQAFNMMKVDLKSIAKLVIFKSMLTQFAGIVGVLGYFATDAKKLLGVASSVLLLSASLIAIAFAFNLIDIYDLGDALSKLIILGGLFLELAGVFVAVAALSKYVHAANRDLFAISGAIVLLSASFVAIAAALSIISNSAVNTNDIWELSKAMALLLGVAGGILAVITLITAIPGVGEVLIIATAVTAAIAMIVGIVTFGAATLIEALTKLINAIDIFAGKSKEDIDKIIENFRSFLQGLIGLLPDFGELALKFLITVFSVLIIVMALFRSAFVAEGIATVLAWLAGIAAALPLILALFSEIVNELDEWSQNEGSETMEKAADLLANVFKAAFKASLGSLADVVVDAFKFATKEDAEYTERSRASNEERFDRALDMFAGGVDDVDHNRIKQRFERYRTEVTKYGFTNTNWRFGDTDEAVAQRMHLNDMLEQYQTTENIADAILDGTADLEEVLAAMEQMNLTVEDVVLKYTEVAGLSGDEFDKIYNYFIDNEHKLAGVTKLQVEALRQAKEAFDAANNTEDLVTTAGAASFIDEEGIISDIDYSEKEIIDRLRTYYENIRKEQEHGAGSVGENSVHAAYGMARKPMQAMFSESHVALRNNLAQMNDEVSRGMKTLSRTMEDTNLGDGLTESVEETTESVETTTNDVLSKVFDPNNQAFQDAKAAMGALGIDIGDVLGNGFINGLGTSLGDFDLFSFLTGAVTGSTALNQSALEQKYIDEWNNAYQHRGSNQYYNQTEYAQYDNAAAYAAAKVKEEAKTDTLGFTKLMEQLGVPLDDVKDTITDVTDSITDATSGLGGYSDAAGTAADATDHLSDSIKSALDIFSGFNVELDMTANDVLRSFSSQLVGVSSWSQELQALAGKGIAQEILDDLAEAGPESYNRVHALYTMSSAQLGLFNKMYSQKLSLEKNTANNIRASFDKNGQVIVEAAENVGIEAGQAIQEGINESASTRVGVNEMEQGVLDAYKLGYEFEYINGVIIPEGIKDSLTKATPGVAAIFGEMGYQSMEAFMHYMNVEDAITMVEGFQETLKDSINNSLNIFDAVSEKEEISAEEMLTRMKENVKNVGKWARNLQELAARGMDEALLAELQALGPEGADKVAAFTKMTDAQLAQANQAFAAKAALPQYVADNLTKSYAEAGYNTTLGFVEGIDPTAADEVMTALGTYSLDALKAALDIHSPSEKTREAGMYTVAGYVLGVTENLPLLQDLGSQMGNTLIDSVFTVDPEKITESVSTFFDTIRSIIQATMESEEINSQPRLKLSPVISDGPSPADYKRAITINDLKMSDMMDRQESRARAANMSPNAQRDYSSDLKSINQTLISTRDDLSLMRKDIMNLQTAFAGLNVTLDGASVGKVITPYVNQNLGQSYVNSKRRSMR